MDYLRAGSAASGNVGVDLEGRVIRGAVLAELGSFKTARGTFDGDSLRQIVRLINGMPNGLPINAGHNSDSGSIDRLNSFIGRARNAYVDGGKVRADIYFDDVAFMSTNGGESLGARLMRRAVNDPSSFSMSLVVAADKVSNPSGGPPIWRPRELQSADFVAVGDATNGLLNAAVPIYCLSVGGRGDLFVTGKPSVRASFTETDDARMRLRNLRRKLQLLNS
jgi:hypothetical protein